MASSVANGCVDAGAIERAPGVDTLLEGIQANSQELPAFRKDAFQKEALRHARKAAADASSCRMERTAPAVLLASSVASKSAKPAPAKPGTSKTAATIDAETPSSPKLVETAPGNRQKRERHVLVALAVICAVLAGGAVFGGLSMLRGRSGDAEPKVTLSHGDVPNGLSLTPHADMLVRGSAEGTGAGASEEGSAAVSDEALAALRAEAEAQLAEASTVGEGSTEAALQPASASAVSVSESQAVHRASRVESTRALSTVPPRSDISRSQ